MLSEASDLATLRRKSFKDQCFFSSSSGSPLAHLKADLARLTTK